MKTLPNTMPGTSSLPLSTMTLPGIGPAAAHALDPVADQAPLQPGAGGARACGALVEAGGVSRAQGGQVAQRIVALRVTGALDQVLQLRDHDIGTLAAERIFAAGLRRQHVGMQGAEQAVRHFALDPRRQGEEPAPVIFALDAVDRAGHVAQRGAVFGEVDALRHDPVQQGFRGGGQLADRVAGVLQGVQHVEQRTRHVEVVGADVLAARRVVVINQGDALVAVRLGAQGQPAVHARGDPAGFLFQDFRRAVLDAGARIVPRPAKGGDHDGLADALQLRQGHAILHRVGRQAVRRKAPLHGAAVHQADGLEHGHVQALERFLHRRASLGGADHEVLQHHQRGRARRRDQLGKAFERRARGAAPAAEQLHAGLAAGFDLAAQGGGHRGVHVGQVEHHDRRAVLQAELGGSAPGCVVGQFAFAHAQPQRRLGPRRGHGHAGGEKMGEQGGRVAAAAALPQAPRGQPVRGGRVGLGGAQCGLRRRFVRQLAQQMGRETAQAAAARARHEAETRFAVEGQHIGARPGVACERILQAPCRVAEHGHRQDAVGAADPARDVALRRRHQLGRGAQQDPVLRMAREVAMGRFDGAGRRPLGDDGKQGARLGGQGAQAAQDRQDAKEKTSAQFGSTSGHAGRA
jgi:hypothetical protein